MFLTFLMLPVDSLLFPGTLMLLASFLMLMSLLQLAFVMVLARFLQLLASQLFLMSMLQPVNLLKESLQHSSSQRSSRALTILVPI
jgi:hypothetical protein